MFAFTAFVAWRRQQVRQATAGMPAAFLFLAAWLSCYHFIYYDTLLVAPAIFLLFADIRPYLDPRLQVLAPWWGSQQVPDVADHNGVVNSAPVPPRGARSCVMCFAR